MILLTYHDGLISPFLILLKSLLATWRSNKQG